MNHVSYQFGQARTDFYLAAAFGQLGRITDRKTSVLLTDEHVYQAHRARFRGWQTIVLKPGERFKVQPTVDDIISRLIGLEAGRSSTLVGVGGGVVTDLAGYVASVYLRGIRFGFVPTSILALVDASIGGKNGIDVGVYKNLVGVIRQPSFILHDLSLLRSLPRAEWENGFAEVIKHACIRDAALFRELETANLKKFQASRSRLSGLIARNVAIKARIVQRDEGERGERRLLNFGHTLGHALENTYQLMHGQAVAIGMAYACRLSEQLTGFRHTDRVKSVLEQYGLPTSLDFDRPQAIRILKMDKKRERKEINYILLERIGRGVVQSIPLRRLERLIEKL
ncbi:MAG TPA: 3-dehydroquinate synthase [Chitinophagaceae bacterium]|nr:3-dehydroquinate synthase [Chitinophagaceae bacterium]